MGVRYGISGHMHASDVAYYHDAAGRTFYDIETGSSVSYASPRRYMTIERYTTADNKAAEKFSFTLHILDKFEGMDQNYESYNDYISGNIYGQLVERVVDHFITVRTIDDLDIPGLVSGLPMGIGDFVEYLVEIVKTELYPNGYPGFEGQTQPTDLMDYIKKGAAQELIGMKFGAEGNELTLAQIFSFIMMAHAAGVERRPRSSTPSTPSGARGISQPSETLQISVTAVSLRATSSASCSTPSIMTRILSLRPCSSMRSI